MNILIQNVCAYTTQGWMQTDLLVSGSTIVAMAPAILPTADALVFDFQNCCLFPGFIDVHVHFREPGFSYKETIRTGTEAAAHGGYTAVCTMPNLNPVPDCLENLQQQIDLIRAQAVVRVFPYAAITVAEAGQTLADLAALAPHVCAFSDDGKGVQADDLMRQAMQKAAALDKMIVAHCEDANLLKGGYIHDGAYAKQHHHLGICSESEWAQVARDLALVRQTNCRYHVCHVSTKESIELIRQAKQEGLDVSCETAPHYLCLHDLMLKEDGCFKMNPPIRSQADQLALVQALVDGTIDMIATDHAPHSAEEKSRGLKDSAMGVVGLETAFPVLYTQLVKSGKISLEKLIALLHDKPRQRFGIGSPIAVGQPADFTIYDLDASYQIAATEFLSKGKSTPFAGQQVFGRCCMTVVDGNIAWQDKKMDKGGAS